MKSKRLAVLGTVAALGLAGCGGQAATSSTAAPPQGGGGAPDTSALAETLAKELGVSKAKVEAALEEAMPEPPSDAASSS